MDKLKVGDIVTRRSYGEDILFKIVDIKQDYTGSSRYVLRGLAARIEADSDEEDLMIQDERVAYTRADNELNHELNQCKNSIECAIPAFRSFISRLRNKPGKILHIDSSQDFMNRCIELYKRSNINCHGKLASEDKQPSVVKQYLEAYKPNILVLTGHDGLKKGSKNILSVESYANSSYYIDAVRIARNYEPNPDKLCIFAGACQSYYEALMEAGANFASSPRRVLINALDPAIVAQKVSITENNVIIPSETIVLLTITGSSGIGGKDTRGQLR